MPTSKQIELAERLQDFCLCQDAVGPLPTFEEVWTELTPLLKTKRKEFYLKMHVGYVGLFQYIKGSADLFLEGWHCETTTESAIEALLYLKEGL